MIKRWLWAWLERMQQKIYSQECDEREDKIIKEFFEKNRKGL